MLLEDARLEIDRVRNAGRMYICHTIRLFGGAIIIIQLSSKQVEPLFEVQNAIIHEIAGTSLDQEDFLVRKIFGEARCDDTALESTTPVSTDSCFFIGNGRSVRSTMPSMY